MEQRTIPPQNGPTYPGQEKGGSLCHVAMIAGLAMLSLLALAGCTPGNQTFLETPAGFWAGLWHGLILAFTFVVSLFSDSIRVYEASNNGALYNLGFVLGVAIFFGGSGGSRKFRSKARREKEKEWEDVSKRVEDKIRKGIESWLEESGQEDKEWEELGGKIAEKIKRELRKWAEK